MARALLVVLLLAQLRAALGTTCDATFADDAACVTALGVGSTKDANVAGSTPYTDDGTFNSAETCCTDTECSLKMTAFLTCKDGALLVADDDPHDVNDNVDDTWNDICRTCAEEALILDGACDTTVADSVYEKAVINSLVVDYEANGANKFISPDWDYGRDGYCPDWCKFGGEFVRCEVSAAVATREGAGRAVPLHVVLAAAAILTTSTW